VSDDDIAQPFRDPRLNGTPFKDRVSVPTDLPYEPDFPRPEHWDSKYFAGSDPKPGWEYIERRHAGSTIVDRYYTHRTAPEKTQETGQ
jgi:hypothetical protein